MQYHATMKKILPALLILFSLVTAGNLSAASRFTGMMKMKLTIPNGTAQVTYLIGKSAQRMDMVMQMEKIPEPLHTTVITTVSQPDLATIINHQEKTYTLVNLKTAAEQSMLLDFDSNYKLERLGTQPLKGYSSEHILLSSTTEKLELWISGDLGNFSTFRILQSQNPRLSNTALSKTLSTAGIEGFPVKIIQHNANGNSTMELMEIKPKTLSPSEFKIPAGYLKVANNQQPVSNSQKAHLKSLMEKMKKFEK